MPQRNMVIYVVFESRFNVNKYCAEFRDGSRSEEYGDTPEEAVGKLVLRHQSEIILEVIRSY